MKLFERVKAVASATVGSQAALGEALGLSGRTFQGYLCESRQNNLWPLLSQILTLYPQVRRDWLYFGEGEMTEETAPRVVVPPMSTAVPSLEAAMSAAGKPVEGALAASGELAALRQKLMASYELNARLTDVNTRLTDEVLRLNEERRKLVERLEWDKVSDKTVHSPLAARGGVPDEN